MTKEEYKEMLKDILNNGVEYEFKTDVHAGRNEVAEYKWVPVDVTWGYVEGREYRKKPPKTWLEETVEDNTLRLEAIEEFYKEFMIRVKKYKRSHEVEEEEHMFIRPCELRMIAKEMGL